MDSDFSAPPELHITAHRKHFGLPMRNNVSAEKAGGQILQRGQCRARPWQSCLNTGRSKCCAVKAAFGRYCFLQLPLRKHSAAQAFQPTTLQLPNSLTGVKMHSNANGLEQHHDIRNKGRVIRNVNNMVSVLNG